MASESYNMKAIGKLCEGKPRAQFDEGTLETEILVRSSGTLARKGRNGQNSQDRRYPPRLRPTLRNIYVKSEQAGLRVMESVKRFITQRLKLKVNESKSAVAWPQKRKFLGFSFTSGKEPNRRKIAPQAIIRFKTKIRVLTNKNRGRSVEQVVENLSSYLPGWEGYFGYCETPRIFTELDSWIRRRLRCLMWRQWKTFRRRRAELMARGLSEKDAVQTAMSSLGPWKMSRVPNVQRALTNAYFDSIDLPRLAEMRSI